MSALSAVVLTLDPSAARAVRRLWRSLMDRGIEVRRPGRDVEPHISLAVYEGLEPESLLPVVEALAPRLTAEPIGFSGLGIFPRAEAVLYLAPKVTPSLLELHAELHRLAAAHAPYCHAEYTPERWVPHCTLAMGLGPVELPRAVTAVQAAWSPVEGILAALALVSFPPLAEHYRRALAPAET